MTASQNFTVTVDETNVPPTFNEGPRTTRSAAENTLSNTDVGSPVSASDENDADTLTYSLSGTDAGSFAFVESTGQIRTSDSLNFESKNNYSVTVTADDGNGGTDSIDVTINVTDVNEAPVGKPIGDRTLARGVLSREIDLSRYFSDPDTNDTLVYTAETPASDTDVATVSVERSMLTIERVSAGSATITVTAADRPLDDDDRLTATEEFTVTVEAQLPTVTIAAATQSVGEGQFVPFTLSAKPAPTTALTVNVSVTENGSFLTGTIPTRVTFARGIADASFTVETTNDMIDEENGTVTATVSSGTGYIVGSSSSASVTVRDDDAPPVPTGLRANGNIVNGEVSIWWEASTGATAYDVRHAVETCTDTSQGTPSVCTPGAWTEDIGIAGTNTKLSAGTGSSAQLNPSVVYRLQVRGTNALGHSEWSSAPVFIYPTSNPPAARLSGPVGAGKSVPPLIATAPLYGHHEHRGSAAFRFGVCDGTIPSGVNIDADDIEAAIEKWEETVKKDSRGNSLIETTQYDFPPAPEPVPPPGSPSQPTPPPIECRPPVGPSPTGDNAVIFASDRAMEWALCLGDTTPACWRSETWDTVAVQAFLGTIGSLPSIAEGTILLRDTRTMGGSASDWNVPAHGGTCTYLEHTLTHEAGHALGIGWPLNDHPRNPALSIMSSGYTHTTRYCEPQAYDVVAIMANYQSR